MCGGGAAARDPSSDILDRIGRRGGMRQNEDEEEEEGEGRGKGLEVGEAK